MAFVLILYGEILAYKKQEYNKSPCSIWLSYWIRHLCLKSHSSYLPKAESIGDARINKWKYILLVVFHTPFSIQYRSRQKLGEKIEKNSISKMCIW